MKKTDFLNIVKETKQEFEKTLIKEYDPKIPDSPENQEDESYYDPQYNKPNFKKGIGDFNNIDWKELYNALNENDHLRTINQLSSTVTVNDIIDENILSKDEIDLLEDFNVIEIINNVVPILNYNINSYEEFYEKAKNAFARVEDIKKDEEPYGYQGNNSEEPYLRGYEPMSEQEIKKIYKQFKNIINENINEEKFVEKITTALFEYVEVNTNTDKTSLPNPEETIEKGKNMKELGQAVEDLGEKTKEIQDKPKTISTTKTIAEYVENEILPPVIEIIKQSENPKATKKELLEMFNIGSKN